MDVRELFLKKLVEESLYKKMSILEIVELVEATDLMKHEPLYFTDPSIFNGLSDHPKKAATKFVLDVREEHGGDDAEYAEYRDFFGQHLKKAKKDVISGQLLIYDGRQWQSVLAHLDALRSYARAYGLKPQWVPYHLDRYVLTKKAELLIDLPEWDNVDRIAGLKDFIKIKNQDFNIFESAFKEWGANIFRRLYQDDAQNRCIILKGSQGIGKDYILKTLLKPFGPYYSSFSSNRDEREAWSQVTSKLILHIEEFDQTGQMSVAFLKDLITRGWATYRSPYGRDAITKKCVGSFISTVNIDAILRDETGNRRFAVFEIESIDWNYPKDEASQILAQFHALFKSGFYADPEVWAAVSQGNSKFEQVDMVPELLNLWDMRVAEISMEKGIIELSYGEIGGVVGDLCRQSGWKAKSICSMLKTNNRSRHTKSGTFYWSALRKMAK